MRELSGLLNLVHPNRAGTEDCQASPFVVGQLHAATAQLRLEDAVLFAEVLDHPVLLLLEPAEDHRDEHVQRNHTPSLRYLPAAISDITVVSLDVAVQTLRANGALVEVVHPDESTKAAFASGGGNLFDPPSRKTVACGPRTGSPAERRPHRRFVAMKRRALRVIGLVDGNPIRQPPQRGRKLLRSRRRPSSILGVATAPYPITSPSCGRLVAEK